MWFLKIPPASRMNFGLIRVGFLKDAQHLLYSTILKINLFFEYHGTNIVLRDDKRHIPKFIYSQNYVLFIFENMEIWYFSEITLFTGFKKHAIHTSTEKRQHF